MQAVYGSGIFYKKDRVSGLTRNPVLFGPFVYQYFADLLKARGCITAALAGGRGRQREMRAHRGDDGRPEKGFVGDAGCRELPQGFRCWRSAVPMGALTTALEGVRGISLVSAPLPRSPR